MFSLYSKIRTTEYVIIMTIIVLYYRRHNVLYSEFYISVVMANLRNVREALFTLRSREGPVR